MSNKPKTLLVLGTHGQKNFGDDLLLESFLMGLSQNTHTSLKFIINSYDPSEIMAKYKDRFSVRSFHTIKEVFKVPLFLLRSDAVLFAGGSILKELFATTNRAASSSLLMILGIVVLARCMGKRVILSHIGASSLTHRFPRLVAGLILRFSSRISFRDQDSFKLAESIYPGIVKKSSVVPDIVFALPRLSKRSHEEASAYIRAGDRIRIGLNLNSAIKNPERWVDFLGEVESVLVEVGKQKKIEVIGIPFQVGFEALNDLNVLNDFKKRLEKHSIPFNLEVPTSFNEIGNILENIDVFLVERFHGVVLALLAGTPLFALMYDPKVASLVGAFGVQEFSADIYTKLDVPIVVKKIQRLTQMSEGFNKEKREKIVEDAYYSVLQLAQYVDAM